MTDPVTAPRVALRLVVTVREEVAASCDLDHTAGMTQLSGHVLTFREVDYQYGVGDLRLRIERINVADPAVYDGEIWYPVEGIQVGADGADLRRRLVLVRARCLPRATQSSG